MPDPITPVPQEPPKAQDTPATPPAPVTPPVAAPSPYSAIESYIANPTPEGKTAAEAALKQAKESQPAKPVVPEKYDLKLPEGSKLDVKHQEAVSAFAKARGLSQQDAQALLERDNLALQAQMDKIDADYKSFVDGLKEKAKADPEIGGEKLQQNVEKALRVLNRFDSQGQVKKLLDESGYGNHPDLIRFLGKIFASMKDDELVVSSAQPAVKKSMEEKFYPNQAQK